MLMSEIVEGKIFYKTDNYYLGGGARRFSCYIKDTLPNFLQVFGKF